MPDLTSAIWGVCVSGALSFRVAESPSEKAHVLRLRDIVYVRDQGRLAGPDEMESTFDRFDEHATYILAMDGDEPLGTVKVIADSAMGLPCDETADLSAYRAAGAVIVELGHLMTVPEARGQEIGVSLMREAFLHSVREMGATHLVGDFFVDESGGLLGFYRSLGFEEVGRPYADDRFRNAPMSLVAIVDIEAARGLRATADERARQLLDYFLGGLDESQNPPRGAAELARPRGR